MTVNRFDPSSDSLTPATTRVQPSDDHTVQQATSSIIRSHHPRIGFVSLGCPKNLVDSERILTQLRTEGYDVVPSYDDAELVVVNTCGFIDSAVQESLEAIGEALAENGKVIVTGCLGAKENQIREIHPKVLEITGPHAYEEVLGHVHKYVEKPTHNPFTSLVPAQGVKLTPRHYAYLKISEGCNHRCTFCIIPSMRGDLVSRPIGEVLAEAKRLKEAGVKEILVISQDTSAYGVDVKHRTGFYDGMPVKTSMVALCEELAKLGMWVRLHYVYPYPHVDDVIPLMRDGKILPYLDIPLQHASPRILKLMKRPGSVERTLERIQKWREICPEITLRSTFIVGFPGETEEEFQMLLDFIDKAELDRVGCFKYSPVEGAKANELPDPVPAEVQEERFQRFMELQQQVSIRKLARKVGKEMLVLIDEVDEEGATGRSAADAPEIDGLVYLNGETGLKPGDMVKVRIDEADEYDLWASLVE
ncbi:MULTISPECIES: 30S ribosomal protein S12 methylthiotransferase RimO [Aeromonas]|uniref:Ribosomal protein uS12 methylthiotransferase RimO n=1 Tax=Aeromonas caviae TaxID=648 RepID=A0ABU5WDJ7_AERCA|nr:MULTISPECIES: 30S ribosomal protein S12 methylthiotransferase RimO [Aeromonas]MEA9431267.1 30S ribosomal protein S12 methylthiotransferase RimO [Aeromonas caviae]MEA9438911.1 30S ribosomal protein S12 methylthiotransferase RimO [Aeromonas caviae]WAF59112.1 30S ribosomal protein S12 methylthiotransferase RimO [Aeromonas caviae]WAF63171.1 30S ribosomal protein S12 methylthiotransferase RimO [Aeromonas caviae]WAF80007.1 30S ribosomal protein S12 methylthiotransferase RimO [Aeromonas caviae]